MYFILLKGDTEFQVNVSVAIVTLDPQLRAGEVGVRRRDDTAVAYVLRVGGKYEPLPQGNASRGRHHERPRERGEERRISTSEVMLKMEKSARQMELLYAFLTSPRTASLLLSYCLASVETMDGCRKVRLTHEYRVYF
jgi:hypothetical protein